MLQEEADALSSRIAIMTNGELQAVGTAQHLKNRFGGDSIELLLQPGAAVAPAVEFVQREFGGKVGEAFGSRLTFVLPREQPQGRTPAHLFKMLEAAKQGCAQPSKLKPRVRSRPTQAVGCMC